MCGPHFSVQPTQGGELARNWVDADGTVFVQDGVSEKRDQKEVIAELKRTVNSSAKHAEKKVFDQLN